MFRWRNKNTPCHVLLKEVIDLMNTASSIKNDNVLIRADRGFSKKIRLKEKTSEGYETKRQTDAFCTDMLKLRIGLKQVNGIRMM